MAPARSVLTAALHARSPREEGLADAVHAAARLADAVLVACPAGTPEIAGARLVVVPDPEDTPAVRRSVEAAAHSRWIVWTEPHEHLTGDRLALRCVLAAADATALKVRPVVDAPWPEAFGRLRVTRTGAGAWEGRVRPRPVGPDGTLLPAGELPDVALAFRHVASPGDLGERTRRAHDVTRAERDAHLAPAGAPRWRALLALGQTRLAADHVDAAVEALTAAAAGGGHVADCAEDLLARVALARGRDRDAIRHAGRLSGPYGAWLTAQALAQLGEVTEAWDLVGDLEETRGPDGLAVTPGVLHEMRALLAFAAGHPAEAAELLATAMATDGQVAGRGALLREMCALAGRPLDPEALLARALPEHHDALTRELLPRAAA